MEMIAEGRRIACLEDNRNTVHASVLRPSRAPSRALPRETESALARHAPFTRGEFLAFHLGNEEYCIEILKVLEIRSHQVTSRLANAPAHITGMLNLRGAIVPVIDLRLLFGMKAAVVASSTVTIVLNILGRTVGMVVDSVSDVIDLASGSILQAPLPKAVLAASGIAGIATAQDRTLVVMDIEALFRNPQVGLSN